MAAVDGGSLPLVKLLLEKYKCRVNVSTSDLVSTVCYISCDITISYSNYWTLLIHISQHCTCIALYCSLTWQQWTPVLAAAYKGYQQILKCLVELGGDYLYMQPVSALCKHLKEYFSCLLC